MFLQYYGLREQPFGVTPNPRYLYHSPAHREALASLIYGIEADLGFAALIADPGMGKTTLLFYLLEKFRTTARTALIFQTLCSPLDLLRYLAAELEIETTETDPVVLNERIKDVLVREAQANRRVIVIIDEAQNLDEPVLETIRLLSDFETQNSKLLHIILAGQLQLAERLAKPGMAQLLQRVSMLNRLRPLTPDETKNYIEYRLGVAGYRSGAPLFKDVAIEHIASLSGGIPREINRICFNALSLGCAMGKQGIDADVVQEVGNDLNIGVLLTQKGAITAETRVPIEDVAEPSKVVVDEVSPAIQWPAFPVASATRTASTDAVAASARIPAGISSTASTAATSTARASRAITATVRPFIPAGRSQARPLSSAQAKPIVPPIVSSPQFEPRLVRTQVPAASRQEKVEGASSSRAVLFAVASVLSAVLALAGWTLWVKPAHDADAGQAATSPRTHGQEVDLPAPVATDAAKTASLPKRSAPGGDVRKNAVKPSANRLAANSTESDGTPMDTGRSPTSAAPLRGSAERGATSADSFGAVSAALIKKVQPVYPLDARRSGIQGSVTVAAVIGTDGKPRNVRAVSGAPVLARAATDAVSQWLYQPYFVNGKPVEVETEVVVDFSLR